MDGCLQSIGYNLVGHCCQAGGSLDSPSAAISAAFWSTCDRLARSCLLLTADTRSEAREDIICMDIISTKRIMNQGSK